MPRRTRKGRKRFQPGHVGFDPRLNRQPAGVQQAQPLEKASLGAERES